jgi:hypothetical protein
LTDSISENVRVMGCGKRLKDDNLVQDFLNRTNHGLVGVYNLDTDDRLVFLTPYQGLYNSCLVHDVNNVP